MKFLNTQSKSNKKASFCIGVKINMIIKRNKDQYLAQIRLKGRQFSRHSEMERRDLYLIVYRRTVSRRSCISTKTQE